MGSANANIGASAAEVDFGPSATGKKESIKKEKTAWDGGRVLGMASPIQGKGKRMGTRTGGQYRDYRAPLLSSASLSSVRAAGAWDI